MNKKWINATAYSQNILHGDTLYNIKRKTYIMVCAELPFAKSHLVMIFYGICNFLFISYTDVLLQYLKSTWSKIGTPNVYIFIT